MGRSPLEKEMTTHSNILASRILWTEEPAGYTVHGGRESDVTEVIKQQQVGAEFLTGTLFIESRLVPPLLLSTGNKFK